MDFTDIKKLSQVLQNNGDQVLNGSSKLSLTVNLLRHLNDSFSLIVEHNEPSNTSFQVVNASHSQVEIFHDLEFLHDFIQKTVGLKISPGKLNESINSTADISKFRCLKFFEIRKVPIQTVSGIQSVRSQLQYIVCVKCLNNLEELLIRCGGDFSSGFMWSELKEAVFSYNNIRVIDKSIEYAPFLQMLDLSHNRISDAQPLDCLPNLKHLNLSYNVLESVPTFDKELSKNLQVLVLKNNYIEDLSGLVTLSNLCELDVSCNCLMEQCCLNALPVLATLQWLCIEGNPFSCHPLYRTITARYLHSNTASVKFILDGSPLSKTERLQVGTYHTTPLRITKSSRSQREHLTSVCSSTASDASTSSDITTVAVIETRSRFLSNQRKSGRVRNAVISETGDNGEIVDSELTRSYASVSSLEQSIDHLETKRQIETLREKFGEKWLHSQSGSIVQDVLGMDRTPIPPVLSPSPYRDDFMKHASDDTEQLISKSPESSSTLISEMDSSQQTTDVSYVTASESLSDAMSTSTESTEKTVDVDSEDEREYSEEQLYIVQQEKGTSELQQLFLCVAVNNDLIRERSAATGKVKACWNLSSLESCERTANGAMLVFDTVRRDRQMRNYIMEDDEAKNLVATLREILSARPLSEMNQTVYRCMKCSTQFSREFDPRKIIQLSRTKNDTQIITCPTCKSNLVIEQDDEERTPVNHNIFASLPQEQVESSLPHSPSHSSIGSAASLQESNSSRVSTTDSQVSNLNRKVDSDIEVLTDPSQDSIEVLDPHSRGSSLTPNRKRSSEERRLVTIADIEPLPAIVNVTSGLTESSSSDSLTDSVCTAYETKNNNNKQTIENKQVNQNKHDTGKDETELKIPLTVVEEVGDNEQKTTGTVGTLSSMLEGFLQSASQIITKPPTKQEVGAECATSELNTVEFSYVDYSQVDHRVKLHLYLNIFEDEQEDLAWLLKAMVLTPNNKKPYNGCVILSTRKLYFLKIDLNNLSDDPQNWMHKSESYTVDRLQTIFTLPWKQGVGLEIRQPAYEKTVHFLCFVQDLLRTSNFLAFLASSRLPDSCELLCSAPDRTTLNIQQLLLSTSSRSDCDPVARLLVVYSRCDVIRDDQPTSFTMGTLFITSCDLVLTDEDLTWMSPDASSTPNVAIAQSLSNLVEVECQSKTVILNFLDESAGCDETWTVVLETKEAIDGIIAAIQGPWEKIFSVPLHVKTAEEEPTFKT